MSCVRTECCSDLVDLDYHCDDIIYIDDEPYHLECALDKGLISEEQAESGEYVFTTEK